MEYLESNGIPIVAFGLQNEAPHQVGTYPHAHYSGEEYYKAMKKVIPVLKERFPNLHVHADSWNGQYSDGSYRIRQDKQLLDVIDAWTFHRIGYDSNDQIDNANYYKANREEKHVYQNEFEYFTDTNDWRFVNTAQSVMNWFTFVESPTWYWLHALKPLYNSEASGFSLGYWRTLDDDDFSKYPDVEKGHWIYNKQNWHSLAGFLKYLPWDSVRYHVQEDTVRGDNRIMAWKSPEGKEAFVITNRSPIITLHLMLMLVLKKLLLVIVIHRLKKISRLAFSLDQPLTRR